MEDQSQEFVVPETNKRQHRRANLVTQVKCDALHRNEILVSRDISPGGLFITTKTPLPLESTVSLFFSIGYSGQTISCKGKVAYSQPGVGMGIVFGELSTESRQVLENFVNEAVP